MKSLCSEITRAARLENRVKGRGGGESKRSNSNSSSKLLWASNREFYLGVAMVCAPVRTGQESNSLRLIDLSLHRACIQHGIQMTLSGRTLASSFPLEYEKVFATLPVPHTHAFALMRRTRVPPSRALDYSPIISRYLQQSSRTRIHKHFSVSNTCCTCPINHDKPSLLSLYAFKL